MVKDKPHLGHEHIRLPSTQKLIGLRLERVPVREGYPVKLDGVVVGVVTSGTSSPTLGYPIAAALVEAHAAHADHFAVEVRGKDHEATRVEMPFYRRP